MGKYRLVGIRNGIYRGLGTVDEETCVCRNHEYKPVVIFNGVYWVPHGEWHIEDSMVVTDRLSRPGPHIMQSRLRDILTKTDMSLIQSNYVCNHKWTKYEGFLESYEFCEKCDEKKG